MSVDVGYVIEQESSQIPAHMSVARRLNSQTTQQKRMVTNRLHTTYNKVTNHLWPGRGLRPGA